MPSLDQNALLSAIRAILRPIVGLLLKFGLPYREFVELAKSVFVEVASSDYGIRGRPTNISRVAILTGLSRKEVKRQRDLLAAEEPAPANKTSAATRVLSGWYQDEDFLNKNGKPRKLRSDSSRNQFEDLCSRYAIEIPPSTMLKELIRVGAVEETTDGELKVKLRYYMPTQLDPQWIMNAGSYLADLTTTINHNLSVEEGSSTQFIGRATEPEIPVDLEPKFQQFVAEQGQQFLETIDDWLADHRVSIKENPDTETIRLGAGVFFIRGVNQEHEIKTA